MSSREGEVDVLDRDDKLEPLDTDEADPEYPPLSELDSGESSLICRGWPLGMIIFGPALRNAVLLIKAASSVDFAPNKASTNMLFMESPRDMIPEEAGETCSSMSKDACLWAV